MNVERLRRILDALWFNTLLDWEKENTRTINTNVRQAINHMKQTNDTGLLYDLLMLHRELNLETIISFKPDGEATPEEPLKIVTAIMDNKELIINASPEEIKEVLENTDDSLIEEDIEEGPSIITADSIIKTPTNEAVEEVVQEEELNDSEVNTIQEDEDSGTTKD